MWCQESTDTPKPQSLESTRSPQPGQCYLGEDETELIDSGRWEGKCARDRNGALHESKRGERDANCSPSAIRHPGRGKLGLVHGLQGRGRVRGKGSLGFLPLPGEG
jgi:hypothetical protein